MKTKTVPRIHVRSWRRLRLGLLLIIAAGAGWLLPGDAQGRISFEALRADGYGMVPIKRPQPNVLTVVATVNGRKLSLIVDTGWMAEGITLQGNSMGGPRLPTEEVKVFGTSASGATMTNFKKARADRVTLGNVELTQVPLFLGDLKSLQGEAIRTVGANGYVGIGFLNKCGAIIDLHNLRLYLRPPGKGRRAVIGPALKAAGLSEAPLLSNCLVDVEINGFSGKMVVDTGAWLAAADMRVAPSIKSTGISSRVRATDASGALMETQLVRLHSFKLGGVSVRAPYLRLATFGFYSKSRGKIIGLLGMDILGSNGTIIDFGQHKVYFYRLP